MRPPTSVGWIVVALFCLGCAISACGGGASSAISTGGGELDAPAWGCAASDVIPAGLDAASGDVPALGAPAASVAVLASQVVRGPPAPPLVLDLNIPAYRLDVFEAGVPRRSYRVAVGMRQFRTPVGSFAITAIEWNPWWVPPSSPWASGERVTPPGPANPMGRVKLAFRPFYFLHGTPHEESLGTAGSHGCVRMSNADAVALARIVQSVGSPATTESEIDSLIADTATTRRFSLSTPVPLRVRYDLVELRRDSLWLYPDIYRRSTKPLLDESLAAIARAGRDTTGVDRAALAAAARLARTRIMALAIDELRAPPLLR
jgi:hypothetical protein